MNPCFIFLFLATSHLVQADGSQHPADTSADGSINMAELTAYLASWQNGESWSDGSTITEETALQASYLWRSGERYRAIEGAPLPYAWVPDPTGADYLGLNSIRPQPMDVVALFDLPVDIDTISGVFTVFGQQGEFPARLDRTETGDPALVVPFNPYDPTGGGRLTFTFTNGDATWLIGPIELQPLPPAGGELVRTRNTAVSWIEDFGTSIGTDITSLLSEPINEVPQAVLPLVALLHEIKGPDVADNLDALLAGTAPSLQGENLDLDFYERILAKAETVSFFPGPVRQAAPGVPEPKSGDVPAGDEDQEGHQVTIDDGVHLARLMQQQATAEKTLEVLGKAEEVIADLNGNMDQADGYLEDLLELDTEGKIELQEADRNQARGARRRIGSIKRAGSYIGWFTEMVKFINYYNNGILPNRFLAMSVNVTGPDSQPFSVEDRCTPADVSAQVDVASQPLTYGAEYSNLPDLLQGRNLPDILPSFEVDVPTGQVTFGPTGVSIEGEWVPEFEWTGIELATGNLDNTELLISVAVIEPDFPFVHVAKTDGPGTSGRVIGSEIHPDPDKYTGEIGSGTVNVSAKAGFFGGKTIQQSTTYGLRALNPLIFEYAARITPGEETRVRAGIPNASSFGNEVIEWEVTDQNGDPVNTFIEEVEEAGDVYLLDLYETPVDEEDYPLQVVFRSTTTECLRGSAQAPPRESRVFIRAGGGFQITPKVNCILEGEQVAFVAEWPGDEIPENISGLSWSIEEGGGQLLATGPFSATYTAPATSGMVVVRAEAEDDASNFATHSLIVNCNFVPEFTFEREEKYLPSPGIAQPERFNIHFFEGAFTGFYDVWIPAAVEMNFEEVVAIGETRSRAIGTLSGVGVVYQQSEFSAFSWNFSSGVDDSENAVEYPGERGLYTVTSTIATGDNFGPSRNLRITPEGELEFRLSGRLSSSQEEDITSYQWNTSSGDSGTGESIGLRFPRSAGSHWVELIVTDAAGNTARQLKSFSMVEIDGNFSFSFTDDRGTTPDPDPGADLPGNFLDATFTGPFAGSAAHGGPLGVSTGPIGVNLQRFQVRYYPRAN